MTDKYRHNRDIQAPPQLGPDLTQAGPRPVKALLAIIATLVLAFSAVGYFTVGRVGNTVASGNLSLGGGQGVKYNAPDGATDILLVGSDTRSDAQGNPLTPDEVEMLHAGSDAEGENTDTIMVIRVPNDGSSATAISIPRDTYIHDEQIGNTKINAVYANYKFAEREALVAEGIEDEKELEDRSTDAGRKGLINAVSNLTGVTVDHYAEIGLLGFVLLTDAVGGVDVCLNEAVDDHEYSGAVFPAGEQTLNGAQGLAFVRQRHGLPRGDLDRIVRQQAYTASLVSKVLSSGTLTNPVRLADLGNAVTRSVVIDEEWDVMSFATQLQNLAGGNVKFSTIPVTSIDGVGDYGESVVTVNVNEVHKYFEDLLDGLDDADAPNAPNLGVTVLNATGTTGLANSVAGALHSLNYQILSTGNAEYGLYEHSQLLSSNPEDPEVQALAEELGVPTALDETLPEGEVKLIVHDDYEGPIDEEAGEQTFVGQPGSELGEDFESPEITATEGGPPCVN